MEDETKSEMEKVIENLEEKFSEIRVGRANPQILNKVMVQYYGVPTPISQVASISVPEARLMVVQPWDRSIINDVKKSIESANIGINPMSDGQIIRLVFPELTEERRKELAKDVRQISENAKISIRNVRRDSMDIIKNNSKENGISEDESRQQEDKVQKITDDFINKIDEITEKKERDIMKV